MVSLAVPTYKRPASLRRLLVSLAESEHRAALDGIYVFDDEETADNETKTVVSQIKHDHNLPVRYAGRKEKLRLAQDIAGCNKELHAILQFALWGMLECRDIRADGENRNALLLHCIDTKVVSLDDDTVSSYLTYRKPARFWEKIIAGQRLQRIQENPFFSFSANGWNGYKQQLVPLADNPFLEFDRVLGSSPQALGFNYPLDGRIKIAHSGVFGGRWYTSPLAITDANPLNYRFWKNQSDYREAQQLPHVLYLSPSINITTNPFFFAAHFGYDTSELLPPFLPHIRNDDLIWAAMVRELFPASPLCRLPFAIHHNSKSDPLPDLSTVHAAITTNGLIHLIIKYISSNLHSNIPEEHLQSLGEGLVSAAASGKASWRNLTKDLYCEMQNGMIRQAAQKLETLQGHPSFLAADVRYYIAVLKREINLVKPWIPLEFARFGARAESLFQDYVRHCGELFLAWPGVWKTAKSLKTSVA